MEVGDFVHTIGDLHIYSDQIDGMKEAIKRDPYPLPKLVLGGDIMKQFERNVNDKEPFRLDAPSMIYLENYNSHPPIKFKMAV